MFLITRAFAAAGVVIRLAGDPVAGGVVVHVVGQEGSIDAELKDDGQPPDVSAGDGTWSAATMLGDGDLTITADIAGKPMEAGVVNFPPGAEVRDLTLEWSGGKLSAKASFSTGAPGGPGGGPSGSPGGGGPGSGPPAPTGPPEKSPVMPQEEPSSLVPIGFGVGLLTLAGLVWFWFRGGAPALPMLPEPGLFGAGTPSLSSGLSVWTGDEGLADLVLGAMAAHHRVLLVGEGRPVVGGPVFRSPTRDARKLGRLMRELADEAGAPPALLWIGATAAELRGLKLPAEIGAVAIVADPAGVDAPVVRAAREGDGWLLRSAGAEVRVGGAE